MTTQFFLVSLQRSDSVFIFDPMIVAKTYDDAYKWVCGCPKIYGFKIDRIEGVGFE